MEETKICTKCFLTKELDDFHKSNMTNDKRQAFCKECNRSSTTVERRKAYNVRRQCRRQDPVYKSREYEKGKLQRINYREKYLLKGIKKRCQESGLPFNITESDIIIPEICPILKIPLTKGVMNIGDWNSPSVDRVIPELGYVKGNIVVMSKKANTMKNNATIEELKTFCTNMLDFITHLS